MQQLQWLPQEFGLAHLVVMADFVAYIKQIWKPDFKKIVLRHKKRKLKEGGGVKKDQESRKLTMKYLFPLRETGHPLPRS